MKCLVCDAPWTWRHETPEGAAYCAKHSVMSLMSEDREDFAEECERESRRERELERES